MSDLTWAWHVHHELLLEPLTGDGITERVAYIRRYKPADEIPTRVRLLRPVQHPERLPVAVVEAGRAYNEARRASDEAWLAYVEARRAYNEARRAYNEAYRAYDDVYRQCMPEIEALHREECPDCPWDGRTIFPERRYA